MKLIKFIIGFLGEIILLLLTIGLICFYLFLRNNDMDVCMHEYKDYDYCKVKIGE